MDTPDIAEKLLTAIEALEQLTQADTNVSWHIVNCGYDQIEFGASCACAVPAAIQGHCAADREIVDKYLDHKRRIAEYVARHFGQGVPLSDHERATWEILDGELSGYAFAVHARARGYGVTP